MPESPAPHGTTSTLPPPSLNGSSRSPPLAPPAPQDEPPAPQDERLSTRISGMRTGLIAAAALTVVMIFIIQNAHAANISFLGIHLVLPLAVALILAAVAGALLMAAAGTARITQLRLIMRRARQKLDAG
jgi:putative membrane protein